MLMLNNNNSNNNKDKKTTITKIVRIQKKTVAITTLPPLTSSKNYGDNFVIPCCCCLCLCFYCYCYNCS